MIQGVITGLAPNKSYEVSVRYRSGRRYSGRQVLLATTPDLLVATESLTSETSTLADAIVGQGDLATLDSVGSAQIDANAVGSTQIAAAAVITAKIAAAAVSANEIAANAVTTLKINDGAVLTAKLADAAVQVAKIQDGAVQTAKLASAAVTTAKIAAAAVTATEIASAAVTTAKINDGAVLAAKLADAAVQTAKLDAAAVTTAKLATSAVTANELAANAVTTTKILDSAISTAKIATSAVTASQLASAAVTTAKIAADAVTAAEIATGAVGSSELAAGSVIAGKVAAGAISTAELAAGAVTAAKIAAGTITATEIASSAITSAKIAANAITASKIAVADLTNIVQDVTLADSSAWVTTSDVTFDTSSDVTVTMGAVRGVKFTADGSVNQTNGLARPSNYAPIEPGKSYRVFERTLVKAGFRGRLNIYVQWYDQATTFLSANSVLGVSYIATPAASDALADLEGVITAPSNAYYCRFYMLCDWPDAAASAGVGYIAIPRMHRAVSAELIVDGTITAAKIAAATITGDRIAAGTVTASNIAAATITAAQLATGSILATKIAVTDTSNLILDANLEDSAYWTATGAAATYDTSSDVTTTLGIVRAFKFTATGANPETNASMAAAYVAVEGGKTYRMFAKYLAKAGCNAYPKFYVNWYAGQGSGFISGTSLNGVNYHGAPAGSDTVGTIEGQLTAPAGANYARFYLLCDHPDAAASAGVLYMGAPRVHRAASGEMIVDGTITAAKIAAGTITGDRLAAGTVTATQIASSTITATQIAAGAIVASKIAVLDLSNLVSDVDFADSAYWSLIAGPTFDTSSDVTSTMGAVRGIKHTATGANPQTNTQALTLGYMPVEAGKTYRMFLRQLAKSGYKGRGRFHVNWHTQSQAFIQTGTINGTDFRTVPAASDTLETLEGQVTAPANAAYCRLSLSSEWPAAAASAGVLYQAQPRMHRAASAELVVDGAITTAKLAALAVTAAKIAAGTITATEIAAATITGAKIASGTITASNIAAGTITATQIAAGAIATAQLAAGAVTASKVVITGSQNLIIDDQFTDASYWTLGGTAGGESYVTSSVAEIAAMGATTGIQIDAASMAAQYRYFQRRIPCDPNTSYRVTITMQRSAGATVIAWRDVYWRPATGGSDSFLAGSLTANLGNGSPTEITFTTPSTAGELLIRCGANRNSDFSYTGTIWFSKLKVEKRVIGSLIVDGEITTAKLAAASVTAAKIAAGTITATEIAAGTITGAKLAAATITADKLSVSSLSAIAADLGTITAGSLNIGSGKFQVASDGTVTIRNAATGARLEIGNSLIKVYDSSDVLRVRMGIW